MILNEREVAMARELARKITKNNDLNDGEVLEVVRGFVSNLKELVTEVWNYIKEVLDDAIKFIHEHEKETEKKYAYNWHVPLKIEAPPMPDIKIPKLINARNTI